jgi:hypothetical protein
MWVKRVGRAILACRLRPDSDRIAAMQRTDASGHERKSSGAAIVLLIALSLQRGASYGRRHHLAPKLLTEQHLYVRLIIDHEYEQIHARPPDLLADAATRGRTILNSVNTLGCVSTSIDPPCCLTMMS